MYMQSCDSIISSLCKDREKQVLDEEGGVETTMMKETQMTSDRDSGTGDEIFSTESTMNGGEQQQVNPTPTTMDNTSNTNELKWIKHSNEQTIITIDNRTP